MEVQRELIKTCARNEHSHISWTIIYDRFSKTKLQFRNLLVCIENAITHQNIDFLKQTVDRIQPSMISASLNTKKKKICFMYSPCIPQIFLEGLRFFIEQSKIAPYLDIRITNQLKFEFSLHKKDDRLLFNEVIKYLCWTAFNLSDIETESLQLRNDFLCRPDENDTYSVKIREEDDKVFLNFSKLVAKRRLVDVCKTARNNLLTIMKRDGIDLSDFPTIFREFYQNSATKSALEDLKTILTFKDIEMKLAANPAVPKHTRI
jgi:hypothetical protein